MCGRVFANGPGDWGSILRRVIPKTQKLYLIFYCLTLSIIRYVSRVKWSNVGKGVVTSPTPRCCSYWKGSFRVALDYSRQLYCLTVANFQNNGKIWISCVDKALLSDGKNTVKKSNGLIKVIQTLLRRKQRLGGGMLTLNAVIQTKMMPRSPKFGSCPGKHLKTPQTCFGRS